MAMSTWRTVCFGPCRPPVHRFPARHRSPTSVRGVRIVPMLRQVTAALAEYINGRTGWKPKDLVWTRSDGQRISRQTTSSAFRTAARSIGREGMVWHDLRHTANTLAAVDGRDCARGRVALGCVTGLNC